MPRFDQHFHKKLLEDPKPERWRNVRILRKEKTLWDHKKSIDIFSSPLFAKLIIFPCFALGFLFLALFIFLDQDLYIWLGGVVVFGPVLLISILLISYYIWSKTRAKNIVQNRNEIDLEKLILNSPSIQKYNRYHIKAIRQTLGHIYSVNPKIIYLSDTPESLRSLGCITEPYGFELILGVGKRLGISLTEPEVDRIADKIHNNAHNVAELTAILCEEMSVAENSQKPECFEVQDVKEDSTTNEYSVWLFPAGLVALVSGLSQATETLKKGRAISTFSSIVSILIVMVISFFAVFIIGILIVQKPLRRMLTETVSCIYYTGIYISAQKFRRAAGTVPNHYNIDTHSFKVPGGIQQCFAFTDRTDFLSELYDIGT
jgi:hypothetical protein